VHILIPVALPHHLITSAPHHLILQGKQASAAAELGAIKPTDTSKLSKGASSSSSVPSLSSGRPAGRISKSCNGNRHQANLVPVSQAELHAADAKEFARRSQAPLAT
jgi:hypothetical protein